jgi:hypothetical protein
MRHPGRKEDGDGPGVPEAVPRTAQELMDRLGVEMVDRLWIFPPRVRGRRESGLLAASRRIENSREAERRLLVTAPYVAERTGKGLTIDWTLVEQGEAPADRFPRMMAGVVRRAGDDFGDPREVQVAGDESRWRAFLEEFDAGLLLPEPEAPRPAPVPGIPSSHESSRP